MKALHVKLFRAGVMVWWRIAWHRHARLVQIQVQPSHTNPLAMKPPWPAWGCTQRRQVRSCQRTGPLELQMPWPPPGGPQRTIGARSSDLALATIAEAAALRDLDGRRAVSWVCRAGRLRVTHMLAKAALQG